MHYTVFFFSSVIVVVAFVALPSWGSAGIYIYINIVVHIRAQKLCESRDGCPGHLSLISLWFLWT